ncbi:MAG TPA: DNA replication and repair protein RecF [Longimicrobiales bacterium]
MSAPIFALICVELRLRDFRNFAELDLAFPAVGAAIIGDNGAGKTNLLEAIYYLETFRSFRGAPDERLVRFGADAFHIRGRFRDEATGQEQEITAAFERRTRRKRVTVGGAEPERLGDAVGLAGVVVFSPSDLSLVAGAPSERRRFLDIVLSLNQPGYLRWLQRYRQVLRQRNAMLRSRAGRALLEPWDEALAAAGAQIIVARAQWVRAHADAFRRRCAAMSGGAGACLRYRPGLGLARPPESCSPEEVEAAFLAELAHGAERERERGMTLAGPHRDDLEFVDAESSVDLREFGSGGQRRTAAIALRMIEADTVRAGRGREPLVLLDDVFAELDPGRGYRLLELLEAEERGQVILTAPKATDLEPRGGRLPHWRIEAGRIHA